MSEENKEVSTVTEQPSQIAQSKFSINQLAENTITDNMQLPKLKGAKISPVPSDIGYLKVEDMKQGDFINGFVWGVWNDDVIDPRTGEIKNLPCLFFLQEKDDSTYAKLRTASKALVGKVETMIKSGEVVCKNRLFPYQIVFNGMKKGKNNWADWSIYPIIIEQEGV